MTSIIGKFMYLRKFYSLEIFISQINFAFNQRESFVQWGVSIWTRRLRLRIVYIQKPSTLAWITFRNIAYVHLHIPNLAYFIAEQWNVIYGQNYNDWTTNVSLSRNVFECSYLQNNLRMIKWSGHNGLWNHLV